MSYTLLIADRSYSSWSLRGWLTFAAFDIPVEVEVTRLYEPGFAQDVRRFAPAKTVPAVRTPEGSILTDSLAIAEEIAQRHAYAGHWPENPGHRAMARSLVAEMHSGFMPLRDACPMNLRVAYRDVPVTDAVQADLSRLEDLWSRAPGPGPWLFGEYSLADAFFAPVAARIAGYGLKVSDAAQDYVDAQVNHPLFVEWRALSLKDAQQDFYVRDFPQVPWPGP